jgi:hypothetical protein
MPERVAHAFSFFSPLRLFTYGQPRTGNFAYAKFVNDAVGVENIYRSVHTQDMYGYLFRPHWIISLIQYLSSVPVLIPKLGQLGYYHHGTSTILLFLRPLLTLDDLTATEYWQTPDPSSPATTKKCDASGEDPSCSAGVPPNLINDDHGTVSAVFNGVVPVMYVGR